MKEYMKMADVFVGEYKPKRRIDAWPPSKHGETLVDISGKPAEYAVHAINSHDELVAEVERLSGIIERAILASNDLSSRCASTQWGDGYRECAIDTGNALKVELNKGA